MKENYKKYLKREQELLKKVDEVIEKGPYTNTWESISGCVVPKWFQKRKFGIFTHWGLYSVPANSNEWYSRNMYVKDMPAFEHHVKTYGTQDKFGYKDFIPMFTAEKFDAKEWISLFKESGAGYIFPVAEHHDGFQMYHSELSEWNSYEKGPKRDILKELKKAAEKEGLMFCTSSHRAEHWFFMGHGKEFESDVKEPLSWGDFYWPAMPEPNNEDLYSNPYPTEEYLKDWLARTCEIIEKYQPALLYFDWWIQHEAFKPYLLKMAAFYLNSGKKWGKDVMICYKHDAFSFGSGIVEIERGGFAEAKPYPWQTDTAIARNSWCYTDTLDYKSSYEIICTLIDVVSKNGNLLLNVGPKPDGSFAEEDKKILKDIGVFMKANKKAIVNSNVWRKSSEGPTKTKEGQFSDQTELTFTSEDFRFTVNAGKIYAFCMKFPESGKVVITSFKESEDQNKPEFHGIIKKVCALGFDEKIDWKTTKQGLEIQTKSVKSNFPVVFEIETK